MRWALSWENTDDFCHIYNIYIYIYIYIYAPRICSWIINCSGKDLFGAKPLLKLIQTAVKYSQLSETGIEVLLTRKHVWKCCQQNVKILFKPECADLTGTLRESIPMLFNGGRTTMTTHCAPAYSQVLPVKPQGSEVLKRELGHVTTEYGVSRVSAFRALQA